MPAVAVREVTHHYPGGGTVLDGVSVAVARGEMVAMCGPSGSGKSTLLSVLGLLLRPVAGSVCVLGEAAWMGRLHTEALRRSAFAWVLQNSACLEARTAVDNVAVVRLAQGESLGRARRGAEAALVRVGLGDRLHARASHLSGGELQRMTVARALLSGRPVVLADEPTGQLDSRNSDLVAGALRACARAGQAVIVATHDLAITGYCDRRLTLAAGTLREAA
jgi:ABC-type lipoprotein export system ATPase subunit